MSQCYTTMIKSQFYYNAKKEACIMCIQLYYYVHDIMKTKVMKLSKI